MRARPVTSMLVPLAAFVFSCGGTEDNPRPEDETEWLEPLVDTGSAPPDCSADNGYEIRIVENWETGSGTGWYTNNDYCQPCADIENEMDEISRPAACLALEPNVETGCDPSVVPQQNWPEVFEDLRESVRYFLPGADPSDDELTELATEFRACADAPGTDADGEPWADEECEGGDLFQELRPRVMRALEENARLQEEFAECLVPCNPTQTPPTALRPVPGESIPGGRCGSTTAVHIRVNKPIQRDGVLGLQFSTSEPLDASEYEGLSFWMRSVAGSRSTFRASVTDVFTSEKAEIDGEPACTFINPKELTDNACDEFGRYFLTTSDWQFFTVPFSEMRQNGFGKQAPYLDIANTLGVSFRYKQGHWDFWIDDIGFYSKQ